VPKLFWLIFGFAGQVLFSLRFVMQWWRSERAGRSVVPLEFWYLSLAGGAVLLTYAVYRRDPVFILGQLTGVAVYTRNLVLLRREARAASR